MSIPRTPFRFVLHASAPAKWWAFAALFFRAGWILLLVGSALVLQKMIDSITAFDSLEDQLEVFSLWGLVFVGVYLLMFIFGRANMLLRAKWFAIHFKHAFQKANYYVMQHSHTYFANRLSGSIGSYMGDVGHGSTGLITNMYHGVFDIVFSLIATIITVTIIDVYFGIVFFVALSIVGVANVVFVPKIQAVSRAMSQSNSKLNGYAMDVWTNIVAVRQYTRKEYEKEQLDVRLDDRVEKYLVQQNTIQWAALVNSMVTVLMVAAVLVASYYGLARESLTIGSVVAIIFLSHRASRELMSIGNVFSAVITDYSKTQKGLEEIFADYTVEDTPNARPLETPAGHILFQTVGFEYEDDTDRPVFRNFELKIPSGQRLGLVGQSGAGKTTFVSLLLRQHDVTSGAILIDGQDIKEVTQDSLRQAIAVVPQEPALFHRTIRENIAYGKPDATDEEIIAVAKKAEAHDFITELPNGYDTMVGERGVKLSGGQRQRVAIARAMLKDAPILILDEATSALDSESEVLIQKALHTLMEGKTVIAIAHRLSTLREMDRLIVLENGQIIEDGTHDQLAGANGTYQSLWEHQAGGFVG